MHTPISVGDFVQKTIPELISGKKNCRILFSTYNTIHGYTDSAVETGNPNLQIVIATGGTEPQSLGFILGSMLSDDHKVFLLGAEMARAAAVEGQSAVEEKLTNKQHPSIAVVYAGLTAFGSAIRMVRELHRESPETFIAVLTCNCNLRTKERELGSVDGIGALVVTPNCGGRGEMRDILNAFKAQWPRRSPAAQAI